MSCGSKRGVVVLDVFVTNLRGGSKPLAEGSFKRGWSNISEFLTE